MGRKSAVSLIIGLTIAGVFLGCQPNVKHTQTPGSLVTNRDEIFSTRPQNRTHFIALIKLKNPALLASATKEDGVVKVDKDLAEIINEEQIAFIEDLQKLSADIKVLYRYRLVINAVTVVAPLKYWESIRLSPKVVYAEAIGKFSRPQVKPNSIQDPQNLKEFNSVKFIGAEKLHADGIRGQGMKVGVIDTGIDFTHSMFGGPGTEEIYKAVDVNAKSDLFPSAKIIGGMDFVGTQFDSASDIFEKRIPQPDVNPMDEGGHGTHVAGTVAGLGDGENTYNGVAPDALLYALKVFGKDGSTSDEVVIAALEYAADPSGDLDLSDQLNVVNMSLGSEYGTPHILYGEAVKNLSHGGTVVVASAGNSGPNKFIVGAPSVSEDAISVAASIDNAEHNWKFDAVKFLLPDGKEVLSEAVEGTISQPIAEAGDLQGDLVYVGLAAQDFPIEVQSKLVGKVALIDRGQVTFAEKMQRAEKAGATAVIVVNNQDGAPFSMGGDGKVNIPAIMISKALGAEIKTILQAGQDVKIKFKTPEKIEKPELIDNLTDFSSQGPRSVDALLKPEISAPGQNVISAKMGGGTKGTAMSGTSMAAPHVAGVMALLKQTHPKFDSQELKSLLMGTADSIGDDKKVVYPISRQGAGRVQVDQAVTGSMLSFPQGLSFGQVDVVGRKKVSISVKFKTVDQSAKTLALSFEGHKALQLLDSQVTVSADKETSAELNFIVEGSQVTDTFQEVSGFVFLKSDGVEVLRMPVLMVARQISAVRPEKLVIEAGSDLDAAKALAHLTLTNASPLSGKALPFNFLGDDDRKKDVLTDIAFSRECDLQAAGYRILGDRIQFAVKIYNGVTTWNNCEVNVQFDNNGDGVADQELTGVALERLEGLTGTEFNSLLLDAGKARQIRKDYEALLTAQGDLDQEGNKRKVDYTDAVITNSPMKYFVGSTIAIVEAPLSEIKLNNQILSSIKISTVSWEDYSIEADDYLGNHQNQWAQLDLSKEAQGFVGLPDEVVVQGNANITVDFKKGTGSQNLMLLMPFNKGAGNLLEVDQQMLMATPTYVVP